MSNMVAIPQSQIGEPEWRSALFAEAVRHTAHLAGPISPFALFKHLQDWLGLSEEECGGEISTTLFLMVRSGLYTSNTYDVETGTVTMAAHTLLTPSVTLTLCMHDNHESVPEEPEI